jgi:hypothetical protein
MGQGISSIHNRFVQVTGENHGFNVSDFHRTFLLFSLGS